MPDSTFDKDVFDAFLFDEAEEEVAYYRLKGNEKSYFSLEADEMPYRILVPGEDSYFIMRCNEK